MSSNHNAFLQRKVLMCTINWKSNRSSVYKIPKQTGAAKSLDTAVHHLLVILSEVANLKIKRRSMQHEMRQPREEPPCKDVIETEDLDSIIIVHHIQSQAERDPTVSRHGLHVASCDTCWSDGIILEPGGSSECHLVGVLGFSCWDHGIFQAALTLYSFAT